MEQGLLHFLIVSDGPQSSFLSGGTAPHFQLKWGGGGGRWTLKMVKCIQLYF